MRPQSKKSQLKPIHCNHCQNDDASMMEPVTLLRWYCSVCARIFDINPLEIYDSIGATTSSTETEVPKTDDEKNR